MRHIELSLNLTDDEDADLTIQKLLNVLSNRGIIVHGGMVADNGSLQLLEFQTAEDDTPNVIGKLRVDTRWRQPDSDELVTLIKEIDTFAEKAKIHDYDHYRGIQQLRHLFYRMQDRQDNALSNVKMFIDQAIVFLRSIQFVAGGMVEGGSKGDMNARARVMIDVIDNVLEQVGEMSDSFAWTNFGAALSYDPWRKDYGKRDLIDKMRGLITENINLRSRIEGGATDIEAAPIDTDSLGNIPTSHLRRRSRF